MKFGLYGFHRGALEDPTALTRQARLAEALGFESIWVGDHVALPPRAPGATAARIEAVAALAFLAGVTSTIRLGAGVIVLPQRQPVLLAQQLATVDRLSRGRLMVGVGVGYVRSELDAFGVRLDERARRTDEYLDVMRRLWGGSTTTHDGEFVSFGDLVQRPEPHDGAPPLIIGGHARASLRRAVTAGDGWFGWDIDLHTTANLMTGLRDIADTEGRTTPTEITVAPSEHLDDDALAAYQELGVDRLVLTPGGSEGGRLTDGELTDAFIQSAAELVGLAS